MPRDPNHSSSPRYLITGIERDWIPSNKYPVSPADAPERNDFFWDTLENGDYIIIDAKYKDCWPVVRSAISQYGRRTGRFLRASTHRNSAYMIVWRQDREPQPIDWFKRTTDRLRSDDVRISDTGDVVDCTGRLLQRAGNREHAERLRALYLISGQLMPQNYKVL